jgi:hypothetical protein
MLKITLPEISKTKKYTANTQITIFLRLIYFYKVSLKKRKNRKTDYS